MTRYLEVRHLDADDQARAGRLLRDRGHVRDVPARPPMLLCGCPDTRTPVYAVELCDHEPGDDKHTHTCTQVRPLSPGGHDG